MSTTQSHFEELLLDQAVRLYRSKFEENPQVAAIAPGRANLIGEHTDYNEGFVLPFALPYATVMVGSISREQKSKIVSSAFHDEVVEFILDENLSKGKPDWANYVKGSAFQYLSDLPKGAAFNSVIVSNVPLGSGLSSSAAIE